MYLDDADLLSGRREAEAEFFAVRSTDEPRARELGKKSFDVAWGIRRGLEEQDIIQILQKHNIYGG